MTELKKTKKAYPPALEANFVLSAANYKQFPTPLSYEISLLGRSNCGKSSLINRWIGRKTLARVGAAPGRTRLINFFKVIWKTGVNPIYVVDLPGYGYAAAPKEMVESWRKLVTDYLSADRTPRLALLLMDIRRKPQKEELELVDWLKELRVDHQLIATKCDKLPKLKARRSLDAIYRDLGGINRPLAFSSLSGEGRDELIRLVENVQAEKGASSFEPSDG
ncbi:MAG: ribosome biogenesis GTP-binding protein YihA/YsxC [Deltaproteobacteria bacterium]|jgi:GTP-binding protein|nr:ribosome biogenesis GTP-binding protein YihA/YsxC [Deltaproteobacteria bacterium]